MNKRQENRFDRQLRFFGRAGQKRIQSAKVAVVGVGGLGTHVVQQLSLLGVKKLSLVDAQELDETNLNRYVGARHDDPIPGTLKVNIGERLAHTIDPTIQIEKISDSVVCDEAFSAIKSTDYVFGCVDNEGTRLVLTELCAAYAKPYFDLASDIIPGDRPAYGGRVAVAWDGNGCLACLGILDIKDAQLQLARPEAQRDQNAIYGVERRLLGQVGPSVVSINGAVVSIAVTEFVAGITGLRRPFRLLNYYGQSGKMTVSQDEPQTDCYYCKSLWGKSDHAEVERYIGAGIGQWLR
ncbi:MAG TPA: ThiF family adenylyltransferase [Candidatus Angelobacter sp.]|nr:ThiF family adenylyltransferase [Candidatus Angelobacter sp.]